MLLCSTVEELIRNGIPTDIINDGGHISRADYEQLSPKLRRHVDPHWVEDFEQINPDVLYGIPKYMSEADAHAAEGPEADALPDFFPLMYTSASLDQTTQPGRNLLRFGTQVNNQGAGPGSLISRNPGSAIPSGAPITSWTNPDGSQNVLQPVFEYTGSSFTLLYYRLAGTMTYHSGHGHFHYDGYGEYRLRHNVGGQPGGYVQRPDGTGSVGAKTGFCLLTFSGTFTTESGANSSTLPGFNQDGNAPGNCGFDQGIRVGRYDQYSSGLEGQWIDITGVPNGSYFVEIELDAGHAMAESNEANNAKSFAVNINANPPAGGITPDIFDSGGLHNDTFATSADMSDLGVFTQTGLTIHWGADDDWFEFVATSTGPGSITSTASNGNVDLYLYNDLGNLLIQSTTTSGTDTVNWSFVEGQEYYVKTATYNSTTSSNYQIAWNIKPTINAATSDAQANELGVDSGVISIGRNGPVTSPLTVNFTVGGTATRGTDYNIYHNNVLVPGNSITIGNLASIGDLEVRPIADTDIEPTETVSLTLNTSAAYVIGSGTSGQVNLLDSGPQVVQNGQVWQTSPHKISFAFNRAVSGVELGDYTFIDLGTSLPVSPSSISYDSGTNTATLTFNGVLPDANYRATLAASSVTDAVGNANQGSHVFNFFVLTGDADHDGRINLNDFNVVAANFGQTGRDGSSGDFDFDGDCDLDDFNVLASKFGTVLAAPNGRVGGLFNSSSAIADKDALDELA